MHLGLLDAVGIEADSDRVDKLLAELEGKDIAEVIGAGISKLASVPSGAGGAVAAGGGGGGGAAAAAGGGAAKEEEKEEEKKEEEEEEDDVRTRALVLCHLRAWFRLTRFCESFCLGVSLHPFPHWLPALRAVWQCRGRGAALVCGPSSPLMSAWAAAGARSLGWIAYLDISGISSRHGTALWPYRNSIDARCVARAGHGLLPLRLRHRQCGPRGCCWLRIGTLSGSPVGALAAA